MRSHDMPILTAEQLEKLQQRHPSLGNRVRYAQELVGCTSRMVEVGTGLSQPYVGDVKRNRYNQNITVRNARKFAVYFGCTIEDLFPAVEVAEAAPTIVDGTRINCDAVEGRIWQEADGQWTAEFPDIPGARASAGTREEAIMQAKLLFVDLTMPAMFMSMIR